MTRFIDIAKAQVACAKHIKRHTELYKLKKINSEEFHNGVTNLTNVMEYFQREREGRFLDIAYEIDNLNKDSVDLLTKMSGKNFKEIIDKLTLNTTVIDFLKLCNDPDHIDKSFVFEQ